MSRWEKKYKNIPNSQVELKRKNYKLDCRRSILDSIGGANWTVGGTNLLCSCFGQLGNFKFLRILFIWWKTLRLENLLRTFSQRNIPFPPLWKNKRRQKHLFLWILLWLSITKIPITKVWKNNLPIWWNRWYYLWVNWTFLSLSR